MWLNVVALSSDALAKVQKSPDLLEKLWFDDDEAATKATADLGVAPADVSGLDYLSLSGALEAMAEATGDDEAEPDFGATGELDYDAGYGPAEYLAPTDVKAAMENTTWSFAAEMDEEVAALLEAATANNKALVFAVS